MPPTDAPTAPVAPGHPGADLGLPAAGPGALAGWGRRVTALVVDWGVCMVLATALFGPGVVRGHDWRQFGTHLVFFAEKALLTATLGASFGQFLTGIAVTRLGGTAVGWWRAVVRTLLVCAVLPAVVIGANRRGLDDLLLGTVVVNRR